MLIASRQDLAALLASPACPNSLVTRIDGHESDPSTPLEPFVGMAFETFEEDEGSDGPVTALDRTLLRHSGRRIVTMHTIAADDGVESVSDRIELVRSRLERLVGRRAQFEASWYPIVVFRRPIREGEIEALRKIQEGSLKEGAFRVGQIPTIYVMDRDLSMTTGRELLSSEWVWTRYVIPLLLRLQAVRSDAAETADPYDVCAWRFMEVGPSIPPDEFEGFLQANLGKWRDERREGEVVPWPETTREIAPKDAEQVEARLACGTPDLGGFASRRAGRLRSLLRESLPSHEAQAMKRRAAGREWRTLLRGVWQQAFGTNSDGTQGGGTQEGRVWEWIRAAPRLLGQVAARVQDRDDLHGAVQRHAHDWVEHGREATRWHRDRVETLASARIMDETEAHFVSLFVRCLLAGIVVLMVTYLFMAVLEPLVPGVPWWLHAGVVGGGLGAFGAAWYSHLREKEGGVREFDALSIRVARLVKPGLPLQTYRLMREGLHVGTRQSEAFSREVVADLAKRAVTTIGRADRKLVAGTVSVAPHDQFGDPSPKGRENRMADEAFYIRTHGTETASSRRDRMEAWKEARPTSTGGVGRTNLERFQQKLEVDWGRLVRRLDPDATGHFPFEALLEEWDALVGDLRRDMYEELLRWCGSDETSQSDEKIAGRLDELFLNPRRRTTDPPGRTCQVVLRTGEEQDDDRNPVRQWLVLGCLEDLRTLDRRLQGHGGHAEFRKRFNESSLATPHWRLHGRVVLLEEVKVPNEYPGHPGESGTAS